MLTTWIRPAASRVVLGLLAVLAVGLVAAEPAGAQDAAADETINGTLIHRTSADDEPTPVEGVVVVVSQDGSEVGEATSGDDGKWEVPLPGPGTYTVRIDEDTLPEDLGLTDSDQAELTVKVTTGQQRGVIFQLGESTLEKESTLQRAGSLFVAGLKLGGIIALMAIGLSLIFAVTGLVNFAHAELVTLGAVIAYAFHAAGPGWPLVVAAIPAVALVVFYGWGQEKVLWKPLRQKNLNAITLLVVSIGLGFAVRFLILIFVGGRPKAYPDFASQTNLEVMGISIVPKHLVTFAVAVVLLVGVGLFLQQTRAGTALRAVRDNPALSESSGINVNQVIALTWVLGAGLAAVGGIFAGVTESVQWDMGFKLLLLMFAAVILGGIGTAYGTMVGAFVVGIAVEMSVLVVPSELKTAVGLALLIVMLILRPQGLLGVRERIS